MSENKRLVKVNDREFRINQARIKFDGDNTISIITAGEADEEGAFAVKEAIFIFLAQTNKKVNIFIDLTDASKPSPKARKVFLSLDDHEKIGKFAIYGAHPVAKVLAHFLLGITKRKDVRFFNNQEEAFVWFKHE